MLSTLLVKFIAKAAGRAFQKNWKRKTGINNEVEVSTSKYGLFFIAVNCLPFLSTIFATIAGKNKYFIEAETIVFVRRNQWHFYFTLLYLFHSKEAMEIQV